MQRQVSIFANHPVDKSKHVEGQQLRIARKTEQVEAFVVKAKSVSLGVGGALKLQTIPVGVKQNENILQPGAASLLFCCGIYARSRRLDSSSAAWVEANVQ